MALCAVDAAVRLSAAAGCGVPSRERPRVVCSRHADVWQALAVSEPVKKLNRRARRDAELFTPPMGT
jgi:hypothetical protein